MAETGHARNVSNFSTLISFCIGYGWDYKPTNPLIQIPSMQALLGIGAGGFGGCSGEDRAVEE